MKNFVDKNSIVREIWANSDTILFIFAGASAEFSLNRAVDWLYFTGRLPSDPLGRLFSTVTYARKIVFSTEDVALEAIRSMVTIHKNVEETRSSKIPDWAYRDVLFMLIDYSIRSFEALERELGLHEKEEIFNVFIRVGYEMNIPDLPDTYFRWLVMRQEHLNKDIIYSNFTRNLYQQYKKQLGGMRYLLLIQLQAVLVPKTVSQLLKLPRINMIKSILRIYIITKKLGINKFILSLILPPKYKDQIFGLNVV